MKTYWTGPGQGATFEELFGLCKIAEENGVSVDGALDHLDGKPAKKRTNLGIGNGSGEPYDITRIKNAE